MNTEKPTSPPDTTGLLRRILTAVEPAKRKPWFELACAIVLALATTASAWCAYQSKLWGGAQAARANAAMRAGREGAVKSLAAMQARAFDASMFITYMQARIDGNNAMEAFLAQRFRPEMKSAVEAWLQLDPLNNPAAPPSPFRMAEYAQKETAEVARQEELAAKAMAASRQARGFSDDYVLLTVVFASVLFFGGIARAFDSRPLRTVLAALAVLLFLGTLVVLTTLPVCHE
jgi:ABC-type multidrug transport system fused ATPase/permease subunit